MAAWEASADAQADAAELPMDRKKAQLAVSTGPKAPPTSWDAIRTAVRRHRAEQPHAHAFAVPRDFCFDDAANRLYFVALETVSAGANGRQGAPSAPGGRPVLDPASPSMASPPRLSNSLASSPMSASLTRRPIRPRAHSTAPVPLAASHHHQHTLRTWSIFYASLDRPTGVSGNGPESHSRRRRKSYADVAATVSRHDKLKRVTESSDSDDETAMTSARAESRNTTLNGLNTLDYHEPEFSGIPTGYGIAHSPLSTSSLVLAGSLSDVLEVSKSLPALPKFLISQSAHSSTDIHPKYRLPAFAAEPFPLLPISWVAKQAALPGAGSATSSPGQGAGASNPRDDGAIPKDPGRSGGVRNFVFRGLSQPAGGTRSLLAFSQGDSLHAGIVDSSASHATFLPDTLDAGPAVSMQRTDVKLSPTADLISYIRNGDIFVSTVPTDPSQMARELRLTFSSQEFPEGGVSCGTSEFVMQEEFGRRTGYWWSPLGSGTTQRILYLEVDERKVDVVQLPRPGNSELFGFSAAADGDKLPYPRAGGINAQCEAKVVEFHRSASGGVIRKKLHGDRALGKLFPWMEYILRAGWLPDGTAAWFQLIDRPQQRLALVKVPLELFQTDEEAVAGANDGSHSPDGDSQIEVLWEESTPLWINAHDCLRFVDPPLFSAKPQVLGFIFASERTGYRHLYHVAIHPGGRSHQRTSSNPSLHQPAISYPHCTIRQLTSGPHPACSGELVGVDEHRHLVYFMGKRDDPTESHLYVCSYAEGQGKIVDTVDSRTRVRGFGVFPHHGSHRAFSSLIDQHHPVVASDEFDDHVAQLTDSGKSHSVTMNPACTRYVDVSSSVADPPECRIFDLAFESEREEGGTSPSRRGVGIAHVPLTAPARPWEGTQGRSGSFSESFSFTSNRSRANSRSSATFPPPTIVRPRMPRPRLLATLPNPKRADTMDDHGEMELIESDEDMFRMQLGDGDERDSLALMRSDGGTNQLPPFSPSEEMIEQDYTLSTPLPVLFSFVNSANVTLYCMLYYPDDGPAEDLPTIVRVYGGPNAQVVTNDWKSPQWTRIFLALKLGYCVLIVDNRGSWERGLAFEAPLQGRFGTVEISDQIEALLYVMCCTTLGEHLDNGSLLDVVRRLGVEWTVGVDSLDSIWARCKAATTSRNLFGGTRRLIDPDRIAVTGWSFGGFLSLMMLARHPNIFRVAVAGAPVTRWELYDTSYTEKFLGLPSANPQGYSRSSVLDVAHSLPDEENRLLIVHGAMDDNVHMAHSLLLVSALVKLNKPHQIQIYPNERHGLKHASNAEHYDTMFFHFLAKGMPRV